MNQPARVQHDLDLCMRCSACSATCPTYGVLGHEGFSPRGRVQVAAALLEERLEPGSRALEFLDSCLHCEACRTACPNGVPVTQLVDLALDLPGLSSLSEPAPMSVRLLLWAVTRPWAMAGLRFGLWLWQRSGLGGSDGLAAKWPSLRRLLGPLAELDAGLPEIPSPLLPPLPAAAALPASAPPAHAPVVGFFLGCVQEAVFAETNRASLALLQRAGASPVDAPGQTCCGALHLHQGRLSAARDLARRNIAAFEASGAEFVINSAGGCGASLKQYGDLLKDDPAWAERAARFAARVRDISEFLVEHPLPGPVAPLPERVTIQDSCHLAHLQGVKSPLRQLLQPVAGGGLVELPRPDQCCGSAGVYNLEHTDLSLAILDRKMEDVAVTGADVVVTANPGCTLQMRVGVARAGRQGRVRVAHVADLLWESVRRGDKS